MGGVFAKLEQMKTLLESYKHALSLADGRSLHNFGLGSIRRVRVYEYCKKENIQPSCYAIKKHLEAGNLIPNIGRFNKDAFELFRDDSRAGILYNLYTGNYDELRVTKSCFNQKKRLEELSAYVLSDMQ